MAISLLPGSSGRENGAVDPEAGAYASHGPAPLRGGGRVSRKTLAARMRIRTIRVSINLTCSAADRLRWKFLEGQAPCPPTRCRAARERDFLNGWPPTCFYDTPVPAKCRGFIAKREVAMLTQDRVRDSSPSEQRMLGEEFAPQQRVWLM